MPVFNHPTSRGLPSAIHLTFMASNAAAFVKLLRQSDIARAGSLHAHACATRRISASNTARHYHVQIEKC